jgi:CRP-like cAMP-binding protein
MTGNGSPVTLDLLEQNSILKGLVGSHSATVLEAGRLVRLETRQKVYASNETINEAYFPLDCVLSIVTEMQDGGAIEVGTVGCEGVSAIPLLLGSTTSANESYCQVPGDAISLPASLFTQLMNENSGFRRLLDRYLQAYINLLGQLAACNRLHSVYERCARWLLLTHDRVKADDLPLTHEYLGMMLGSRRSGVTIAAAAFRTSGFIRYNPGHITILDREGLEQATCECYAVAQEQFAGLLRS